MKEAAFFFYIIVNKRAGVGMQASRERKKEILTGFHVLGEVTDKIKKAATTEVYLSCAQKAKAFARRDEAADTSAHATNRYREQYFIKENTCFLHNRPAAL